MIKKALISVLIVVVCITKGFSSKNPPAFLWNSVVGYQQGFGFGTPILRPAFDLNLCYLFYNGGFNYEKSYGPSLFVGAGVGSLLQLQYGNGFALNKHIVRVRMDFPLGDTNNDQWFNHSEYISVGMFCDYRFNSPSKFTIGLSMSISLAYPFVKYGIIK